MVAPLVALAGIDFLSGFLSNFMNSQAQEQERKRRLAGVQQYIGGPGYLPDALPSDMQGTLKDYMAGKLTPGQQSTIDTNRTTGMDNIMTAAAGAGTPAGGRMALASKLNRDLTNQSLQYGSANQQIGLQYSLADFLNRQTAKQKQAELLAASYGS